MKEDWDEIYRKRGGVWAASGVKSAHKELSDYLKRQWSFGEKIIECLGVSSGAKILDLGCGSIGTVVIPAIKRGINVVGLDISGEPIVELKKRIGFLRLNDHYDFLLQDMTAGLPFEDDIFDGVTCVAAIMHVEFSKVLSEIYRVTKAGGKIYINSFLNRLHPDNIQYIFAKKLGVQRAVPLVFYDWCEIVNLLHEYGFRIEKIEAFQGFPLVFSHNVPYPDFINQLLWIKTKSFVPLAREWRILAIKTGNHNN